LSTQSMMIGENALANTLVGDRPLRVIHVVAGLATAHGGPSYSVPRLCQELSKLGLETELLSVSELSPRGTKLGSGFADKRFREDWKNIPVLGQLRISLGLFRALGEEVPSADVVHNHGLWLMPNVAAGYVASRQRRPLVVAPRGMLSPAALSFSRYKKWAFWNFVQGPAIQHASCYHATSEQEYTEIRKFGIKQPVAVIANGIDLQPATDVVKNSLSHTVLALGRIHPKKGLDRLLQAWALIEHRHPIWRLRIVGPSELGHEAELLVVARNLGVKRISIEPALYGFGKYEALREANIFVLPTLNENFGLTVAESLAAGTPVISTKGAPWQGLEIECCGWWIDHGIDHLAKALERAMQTPVEELAAMGVRGQRWMLRDFDWESVARNMAGLYSWLAKVGERPNFVYLD